MAGLGASVKNVTTKGEMSAIGIGKIAGVYFLEVPPDSPAAAAGLHSGDVIVRVGPVEVESLRHLGSLLETRRSKTVTATVYNAVELEVELPVVPPPLN